MESTSPFQVPSTRTREQARRWIRSYGADQEAMPLLVCLPHAGGAATFYRHLASLISDHAAVWAIQYPGRQDRLRDPFSASMEELTRSVAAAVLALAGDRSITLFGHSMGSLVAFEVASLLESAGLRVQHLVASGRGAPSIPYTREVASGSDDDLVAELLRMEGTDPSVLVDPQVLELALPAVRADYRLLQGYAVAADETVRCPVTVLHGDRDPLAPPEEVHRWRDHSQGVVRFRAFSGGHFFLVEHAHEVAEEVIRCLE